MQGLDEEGLRAYTAHLQETFLRPQGSGAGSATAAAQNGNSDVVSNDEDDDGDSSKEEAAPEDAGRRCALLISLHQHPSLL